MTYRRSDVEETVAEPTDSRSVRPPSTRVAYRLAEQTGKSIEELQPLATSVDPEALDSLFAGRDAEYGYITFRHEGHRITVTGAGDVLVDPVDGE